MNIEYICKNCYYEESHEGPVEITCPNCKVYILVPKVRNCSICPIIGGECVTEGCAYDEEPF